MAYNAGMTISEVLTERLADGSTTQEEAAVHLGVSQATVNRWVKGKSSPSTPHVPALVAFTGLDEPTILDAIHRQKLKDSPTQRIDALERQVEDLIGLVDELRATIERGP